MQLPQRIFQFLQAALFLFVFPAETGVAPVRLQKCLAGSAGSLQARLIIRVSHPVQKGKMHLRIHEELMLMLAVNIHQADAYLPQEGNRHKHAADPAQVFAGGGDLPPDGYRRSVKIDALPGKDCGNFRMRRHIKHSLNTGPVASGADQPAVRPAAEDQVHRIHDNAFSRAGFAGHHLHAGMEQNLQVFNQHDVLNAQGLNHGSRFLLC